MDIEKLSWTDQQIRELKDAASIIKAGGLVIYPTETVYGLAADPYNRIAVLKVFGIKKRSMGKPLTVAVCDMRQADELVFVNSDARKLAEEFLPGPLTIIMKKKARLPKELNAGMDTLGIRIPDHPLALKFIESAGPVTSTSANITDRSPPTTAEQAKEQIGNHVNFILDGGECDIKTPSTIVDITKDEPEIVRVGAVKEEDVVRTLES